MFNTRQKRGNMCTRKKRCKMPIASTIPLGLVARIAVHEYGQDQCSRRHVSHLPVTRHVSRPEGATGWKPDALHLTVFTLLLSNSDLKTQGNLGGKRPDLPPPRAEFGSAPLLRIRLGATLRIPRSEPDSADRKAAQGGLWQVRSASLI